jgi:hypothetical protein
MKEPSIARLSSCLTYAYKKGLKTLLYYLRTTPAAKPDKNLGIQMINDTPKEEPMVCTKEMRDSGNCESCGA